MRVSHVWIAFYIRVGLVFALLWLLPGRAAADSLLRLEAGATALRTEASIDKPGFTLGGALALARWQPLANLAFVPQLELLFARRNARIALDPTGSAPFAMDFFELPLLLRSELTIGSRAVYVLAGVYGSVLLRAQRTNAVGIVDKADTASPVDAGYAIAAGFELASFAWGELFMEARYQRGYRALLRDSGGKQEALSLLLGYGLSASDTRASWSRVQGQRLALKGGPVATRLQLPELAASTYSPGFSFGGALSFARAGSRIALVPQLELAFVHRSARDSGAAKSSLTFDSIDLSMLVRGEVAISGHSVYGLGGVYGSALLRAERTQDGATTDVRDAVGHFEVGWLAGAGIELASSADAALSIELRYQRGLYDLFPASPDQDVTYESVSFLFGIVSGRSPSPRAGPARPDDERPPGDSVAALDAMDTKVTRLITAMETASSNKRPSSLGKSPCRSSAALPVTSGVMAMPAECTIEDAQQVTRDALHTILLDLTKDFAPLLARLRRLTREERYGEHQWLTLYTPILDQTVTHTHWMVNALHTAQELIDSADLQRSNESLWQQAGRYYEAALLGAQVLSLWVSWLEFAKSLHLGTTLNPEWILLRVWRAWDEMIPVLGQLQRGEPSRIRAAAQTLQSKLPAWSDALYQWGKEAESQMQKAEEELRTLLVIQAAFDLATTRQAIGPLIGRARAFAFVLPGIGGITAGGVATGIRVVISAEWVKAMQHLIAIGAITTIEIAQIAGVSSMAMSAGPKAGMSAGIGSGLGSSPERESTSNTEVQPEERSGTEQAQSSKLRWGDSKSKPTYGHTFLRHTQKIKSGALIDRARALGKQVGQWLNDSAAAKFIADVAQRKGPGVWEVPLPKELRGRAFLGDGTQLPVDMARVIVKPNGSVLTAFPYNSALPN